MADDNSVDYYKALFEQEAELRQQAEGREQAEAELRRQAEEREQAEAELRRQAEEREQAEAELRRQAEEREQAAQALTQRTTFTRFIQACHALLSLPLKAGTPTKSTKGPIPLPTGKYCPTRLRLWSDCPAQQQEIYNSVYTYLQPPGREPPQILAPLAELQGLHRRFSLRTVRSEKDLERYEGLAVEDHVRDIIAELCKIPDARERFRLGDGITFDNHRNALEEPSDDDDDDEISDQSTTRHPRPDQFCIHRVDGTTNTIKTSAELKPPHKLRNEDMRSGLHPMEFWRDVVNCDKIPTDKNQKLKYNAKQLTGSVLVQQYHVMIQEGLEYSYITNGLALILLRVPYDDPSTLFYYFCEPNLDVNLNDSDIFRQPKTVIARVLCLCLMSFRSRVRNQAWRHSARAQLHLWKTSFDHTRSQIPSEELQQNPPDSEYTSSEYTGSEYFPSSPLSPTKQTRRASARFQGDCAPIETVPESEHMESSDSDSRPEIQSRKRGFSQVVSSPPSQRPRQTESTPPSSGPNQQHTSRFCTQRCLLGLQRAGTLDYSCPNVHLHRQGQGQEDDRHCIDAEQLMKLLQKQLGEDLDHNCTPLGECGSSGAPFKITCATYGYTVVGKGTTSRRWGEVSGEAEIYQILQKVQGLAVPVFLGAIDLKMFYYLHGAGKIRHMLLMAWAGKSIGEKENLTLRQEIIRSERQIRELGVKHQDLRLANMRWNKERRRVLIIDFHQSQIDRRPTRDRVQSLKRSLNDQEAGRSKQARLVYT